MTAADWLANLYRLCSEATPGPWSQDGAWIVVADADGHTAAIGRTLTTTLPNERADAAFIAAAREAVPRLLDMVEAAQEHVRICIEELARQLTEAGIDAMNVPERARTLVDGVLGWSKRADAAEARLTEMIPARDHEIVLAHLGVAEAEIARLKAQVEAADGLVHALESEYVCDECRALHGPILSPQDLRRGACGSVVARGRAALLAYTETRAR